MNFPKNKCENILYAKYHAFFWKNWKYDYLFVICLGRESIVWFGGKWN